MKYLCKGRSPRSNPAPSDSTSSLDDPNQPVSTDSLKAPGQIVFQENQMGMGLLPSFILQTLHEPHPLNQAPYLHHTSEGQGGKTAGLLLGGERRGAIGGSSKQHQDSRATVSQEEAGCPRATQTRMNGLQGRAVSPTTGNKQPGQESPSGNRRPVRFP